MMNAELNRISHLLKVNSFHIDVFTFQLYPGWLTRLVSGTKKVVCKPASVIIDEIPIKVFWRSFSLIDYFLSVKLHKSPLINKDWELKYLDYFKGYDLIVANSYQSGFLAYTIFKKYQIAYCVTWHGTDIHTAPFNNGYRMNKTRLILESATMNFMVSKALEATSKKISNTAKTMVLYNGVNSKFQCYPEYIRIKLREEKSVMNKKVVAFAGHLIEVKNPQLFPEIFKAVKDKYDGEIAFWIMGSGKMGNYVKAKCEEYDVPLTMWGNISAEDMPKMLNCVDVQILPSRNEGLPLIAAEAMACGANAVGAKVGGIPEVMGEENTFDHGVQFVDNISNRIVYMLSHKVNQPLAPHFSWSETAKIENDFYMEVLCK